MNSHIRFFLLFFCPGLMASAAHAGLEVYPGPSPDLACPVFQVRISQDGVTQEAFVIQNVSDWETRAMREKIESRQTLSYAGFSFTGQVTVEVRKVDPATTRATSVLIRPERAGIQAEVSGDTARFTIEQPGQYSVEFVDGDLDGFGCPRHALMIFADPPEDKALIPDPNSKQVVVVKPGRNLPRRFREESILLFKPGIHKIGPWKVPSTIRQVYLAPGAFVSGALRIEGREDGFLLNGRGTLSGKSMDWHLIDPNTADSVEPIARRYVRLLVLGGRNITVDGITLTDSPYHTVIGNGNDHLIRWTKLIGWNHDNTGIQAPSGSVIENCFIHTNDDAIRLYEDDLTVRNCVFWQGENGACFQLGWHSNSARNARVHDITVIHTEEGPTRRHSNSGFLNLRLSTTGPQGPQVQEDFLFENIHIETPSLYAIDLRMRKDAGEGGGPHTIRNFTFRNLDLQLDGQFSHARSVLLPWSEDFGFENIQFDNVRVNGVLVTEDNYANEGRFDISPVAKPQVHFIARTEPFSWKNPLASAPQHLHQPSIIRTGARYHLAGIPNRKEDDEKNTAAIEIWSTTDFLDWEQTATIDIGEEGEPGSPDIAYHPGRKQFYLTFERQESGKDAAFIELLSSPSAEGPWQQVGEGRPLTTGSDPSLCFGLDDRSYLLLAGVTIREIDLETGKVVDGPVTLVRPDPEKTDQPGMGSPTLRPRYRSYHLFWTEAGEDGGSVHTASSPSIWGPYRVNVANPIYGEPNTLPFESVDIFEGPDAAWWIFTTQARDARSHHSIDRIQFDEGSEAIAVEQTRQKQEVQIPARAIEPEPEPEPDESS